MIRPLRIYLLSLQYNHLNSQLKSVLPVFKIKFKYTGISDRFLQKCRASDTERICFHRGTKQCLPPPMHVTNASQLVLPLLSTILFPLFSTSCMQLTLYLTFLQSKEKRITQRTGETSFGHITEDPASNKKGLGPDSYKVILCKTFW